MATEAPQKVRKCVWKVVVLVVLVVPAIAVGFLCSCLLWAIKLATGVRNGTCEETGYSELLDTEMPLVACTVIEGANRWLFYFLPFSGLLVAALYEYCGNERVTRGFNTVLESIKKLKQAIVNGDSQVLEDLVSLRMCPLVFVGTVLTHLFGGSAGREGSALQMSAAIFSKLCDFLGRGLGPNVMTAEVRHSALVASISAGFSGVFGVPVTGTIFAAEVLRVGEITVGEILAPALTAAFFADWTCRLVSKHIFCFEAHSHYECQNCQLKGTPQNWIEPSMKAGKELLMVIPAAFAFGLCSYAFHILQHSFKEIFGHLAGKVNKALCKKDKAKVFLKSLIGGEFVVLLWLVLCCFGSTSSLNFPPTYAGNDRQSYTFAQSYLGLSVYEPGVGIGTCFLPNAASEPVWGQGPLEGTPVQPVMWYDFLLKMVFTTMTLGANFKGGEVTPIFFIGASLGTILGVALGQDMQLFSALGFVSVFAAAANTPIACTFMGIELFGGQKILPFLVSCHISFLVSNFVEVNGIYVAPPLSVEVAPLSQRAPVSDASAPVIDISDGGFYAAHQLPRSVEVAPLSQGAPMSDALAPMMFDISAGDAPASVDLGLG